MNLPLHPIKESEIFQNFEKHDRNAYPPPVYRVTGGMGGEALLILGSEKTALYDGGMACFADRLIENMETIMESEERTLDYVLLSHTHYDHIGGLPYVLERWPEARVYAAAKAKQVFSSDGARATIRRLGVNAAKFYGISHMKITTEGLRVDEILEDGDRLCLGREWVEVYQTPGHTDCALAFFLLPQKILFTSESTGVLVGPGVIDTSALKDFDQTIEVAERFKKLSADYLISPHYGLVPPNLNQTYFDMYIEAAQTEKAFIEKLVKEGKSQEEILNEHEKVYWKPERGNAQPYAAYRLNTENIVKQVMNKYEAHLSSVK